MEKIIKELYKIEKETAEKHPFMGDPEAWSNDAIITEQDKENMNNEFGELFKKMDEKYGKKN